MPRLVLRRLGVAVAVFAGLLAVAAATPRIAARVPRGALEESLAPTEISQVPDMSGAVYGLVANDPTAPVTYPLPGRGDPTIFVDGVGEQRQRLCVQISRAQGGYRVRFEAIAPAGRGPVTVPFDSADEARRRLREIRPSALEMALRVTEGIRGECRAGAPLLPSSWARTASPHYTLLVGGSATGVPATRTANGPLINCRLISQELRRPDMSAGVYAYSCPIAIGGAQCGAATPIKVLWFQGSRLAAEARISAKAPCGASRS